MNEHDALSQIQELLSGRPWTTATCDLIADILDQAGYPVQAPEPEKTGFRAIVPKDAAHAAVLEDLARRIDDD